jgi:hypothetical protein
VLLLLLGSALLALATSGSPAAPEDVPAAPGSSGGVSDESGGSPAESSPETGSPAQPSAVIIDQLYALHPNPSFVGQVTGVLEGSGFEVVLYQGDEVTVDLYGRLADMGHELLLFRAHSGLIAGEEGPVRETTLFTNEPYTELKHVGDQLAGRLARGRMREDDRLVFAINDEFVRESIEGRFDDTAVIMMGCSCLQLDDLASAFLERGASAYLAWHATVDLGYVDRATLYLLERLCQEGQTVGAAVQQTMAEVGPDPQYGAKLKYRPAGAREKTLGQLVC